MITPNIDLTETKEILEQKHYGVAAALQNYGKKQ